MICPHLGTLFFVLPQLKLLEKRLNLTGYSIVMLPSDTGALPVVADLQKAGLDIQMVGYGVEEAYHADNEYGRLSDFTQVSL